jgi:hypothetical protein
MKGKEHANLLGIFAYVFAGFQGLITGLFGLYLLLLGGLGIMAAFDSRSGDAGGLVMMLIFAAVIGVMFGLGLASIIMNIKMGRRLRSGDPPAQRSVMITSILNCCSLLFGGMMSLPFGAAVGAYGIRFATSDVGKRYLSGIPDAEPVYMNPPPAQTYAQSYTPDNEPYKWR